MTTKYLALALAGLILLPTAGFAQLEEEEEKETVNKILVVNAVPAAILLDIDGSKLRVSGPDGETRMSQVFTIPNLAAGIGAELNDEWFADLTAGAGFIINDSFQSLFLQVVAGASCLISESFRLGPRAGLIFHPDPNWSEDDNLDFDSATGFILGAHATLGDRVKYFVSVDLVDTTFDFSLSEGSAASDDDFDLTGIAVQFGVRGEF
ncbi:MAG: hypothetical protein GWN80_04685 [Gammaproteobacteria bacterium]|nr:hypothetical protein [Gammaproteobacteria bacterium]